jgi:hypothetical protein
MTIISGNTVDIYLTLTPPNTSLCSPLFSAAGKELGSQREASQFLSSHVVPIHIIVSRIVSLPFISPQIASYHLVSYCNRFVSPHIALHHLVSYCNHSPSLLFDSLRLSFDLCRSQIDPHCFTLLYIDPASIHVDPRWSYIDPPRSMSIHVTPHQSTSIPFPLHRFPLHCITSPRCTNIIVLLLPPSLDSSGLVPPSLPRVSPSVLESS